MTDQDEWTPINELEPYHRNPRTHDNQQIQELMTSIRRYAFRVPIVITADNVIVAGHARYKAVHKLQGELDDRINELEKEGRERMAENLTHINQGEIMYRRADELKEHEITEYRSADNKISELSTWDYDDLKFEMRESERKPPGWSEEEIDQLLDFDADFMDVTDEDVEQAKQKQEEHYRELADAKHGNKIELPCPNCGETIKLSKDELQRKVLDNE